jgi:Tfp pilus assembly protein PilO
MDKTRLWIIGSVLAMVVVAALGWVLAIQPQLDQSAAADAQTAQVNGTNAANQAVLAKLKKESAELPALKDRLAALGTSVPSAAQIPAFADELNGFAAANGVTITGWQIADAQGFVPPVNPAAPVAAAAPSGSSATPAPTATPTPSATPTPTPVPTAVAGMPPAASSLVTKEDFTAIPVSVSVRGEYPNIVAFVAAAQKSQRLFMVNSVNVGPAANGPGFDGKVGGLIYVLSSTAPNAPAK